MKNLVMLMCLSVSFLYIYWTTNSFAELQPGVFFIEKYQMDITPKASAIELSSYAHLKLMNKNVKSEDERDYLYNTKQTYQNHFKTPNKTGNPFADKTNKDRYVSVIDESFNRLISNGKINLDAYNVVVTLPVLMKTYSLETSELILSLHSYISEEKRSYGEKILKLGNEDLHLVDIKLNNYDIYKEYINEIINNNGLEAEEYACANREERKNCGAQVILDLPVKDIENYRSKMMVLHVPQDKAEKLINENVYPDKLFSHRVKSVIFLAIITGRLSNNYKIWNTSVTYQIVPDKISLRNINTGEVVYEYEIKKQAINTSTELNSVKKTAKKKIKY